MNFRKVFFAIAFTLMATGNLGTMCRKTPKETGFDTSDPCFIADADGDWYDSVECGGDDCDDENASVHPDATEICDELDNDCDGDVDEGVTTIWHSDADGDGFGVNDGDEVRGCSQPDGYVYDNTDCDDENASVNPAAPEICDHLDNDCDGTADDGLSENYYVDDDGDGYGDPSNSTTACSQPDGYVDNASDCDDGCVECNPTASEICDELDNDCDSDIDEGVGTVYYMDADGDGYGTTERTTEACSVPTGYATNDDDCDDNSSVISPEDSEICDHLDNDCDGNIDEADGDVTDTITYYYDADGDGYGDPTPYTGCELPSGYTMTAGDCDDTRANVNPSAPEICNSTDDDCDGTVDESDALDATAWYYDADGDGFGTDTTTVTACLAPTGYVEYGGDCNDGDTSFYPGAYESCSSKKGGYDDTNCDGVVGYADEDGDDAFTCDDLDGIDGRDCNDSDASVYPGASETCNGVDDDCDGTVDESDATDATTWYYDADGDGYGSTASTTSCDMPMGYVDNASDCDDGVSLVNPAGSEICDGLDNDCDSGVDELARDMSTWFADTDGDGYGDASSTTTSCSVPSGYVDNDYDCNDASPTTYPSATETCDGLDNDCDSDVDESVTDGLTWYLDSDGDGYGTSATTYMSCDQPSGYVSDATDCNDGDGSIHPSASESCDSTDSDCDGSTNDTEAVDASTWYADVDSDGYGDASSTTTACWVPPNYVSDASDCNDGEATVNPGATEVCDYLDNDCDGTADDSPVDASTWYRDADNDGYGVASTTTMACDQPSGYADNSSDCNDSYASVNPGASETCNGVDDDCDGTVDEGGTDSDHDGYDTVCDGDCDDGDASVHPGATESCNGVDDDCDGSVDEGMGSATTWYRDADGDGYGDASNTTTSCSTAPSGYVSNSTDCDDSESLTYPGAEEVCGDGADNDCDGDVDYLTAAMLDSYGEGYLIVTEFLANPSALADASGEYAEIYNASDGCEIDLAGVYYGGSASETPCDLSSLGILAADSFLVVGRNAAAADGDVDLVCSGITLSNTGDTISLETASTTINEITYDSSWPIVEGSSTSLCWNRVDDNSTSSNWYAETVNVMVYGDYGTPGSENETCAAKAHILGL